MDKIKKFRQVLIEIMDEYTAWESTRPNNRGLEYKKILDEEQQQYQFVEFGWDGDYRIYELLFHVDIRDGKIWIQKDTLEESLAERLENKGISKKDIVLAYFPESHRKYTEYAVA